MNTIMIGIKLLGGLAMFLYGMEVMGDGLKQGSGATLKNFLGKLTQNALLGVLTGALVTAIIQSSTATIVLTVGLIGAGVLNLKQAVSIVLGANIGTTVTAQIIRLMDIESSQGSILNFFKPDTLAPLALIIGIVLIMFIKKEKSKNVGTIALGFGVLFTGLMSMTAAVEPLAESQAFIDVLSYFSDIPILGIVTGLVLTVIIQSSSATTVMAVGFVNSKILTLTQAINIIMGANIGTTVTGLLLTLDVDIIAPILAFIGMIMQLFIKKRKYKYTGTILFGFGILFMGMNIMGEAVAPLADNQSFIDIIASAKNPLLGVVIGALFTAVIQSSSSTTGILITLANAGMLEFDSAFYLVLGQNIGT